MSRIILICFTIVFFCVGSFSHASSERGDINIKFSDQIMSAELKDVPLRLVLEKFNNEIGIWFKVSESALETKISIRFSDLSVEEGLKRILSKFSYALFFNQDQSPAGLLVVEKGNFALSLPRAAAITTRKTGSFAPEHKATPFPAAKSPFSHQKEVGGGIYVGKTHSLQFQKGSQKFSDHTKFGTSSGNKDESIPEKINLFSQPIGDSTNATNPFAME